MSHASRLVALVFAAIFISVPLGFAQQPPTNPAREDALRRLRAAQGGAIVVSDHKSTGAARFVRAPRGSGSGLTSVAAITALEKAEQSRAFFREYGPVAGITDPFSMRLTASATDALGETHLTWRQFHGAVPVFGTTIKTHFDRTNRLKAVTGTAIPDIAINASPTFDSDRAAQAARAAVVADRGDADGLRIGIATLYIYREGLAQGVPGLNHLAWEIEITDGAAIRDLVYVGAHSGKVIDKVSAVHDELNRRAFDGKNLPFVPPNYPQGAYWLEGQRLPTNSVEANNMLFASKEIYDLFKQTFNRDSFDGKGAFMDAIFDRGYGCPNASWNGVFISFCPGFTTDDVTAHEWGHAYTEYTHGLIYQWQPGALNEAYSDIWGEVVDQINNRGSDAPGAPRTANSCSVFSPPVAQLLVTSPAAIAGEYFAQAAFFGPQLTSPVAGELVAALDAADASGSVASTLDGCTALTNAAAVSSKIALINRGTCEFATKVFNAQQAGAIGVVIANNVATGLPGMGPGVDAAKVTIPSIGVQQSTGTLLRTQLAASAVVNVTLRAKAGTDASYSWLMGEDITEGGALRDMWNPTCYSNPGKVSDTVYYHCDATDAGGVHRNSGVPNHGFALLVQGGAYNGQTIQPIGLTKAAHIYFRAQDVYQVFDSDFADHADALETSCADLIGQPLNALPGGPATDPITSTDCAQVTSMITAVELRTPPTCNFAPLLDPRTASTCSASTTSGITLPIASFDFETDPMSAWTVTRSETGAGFTARDWSWRNDLPDGRTGSAFFAPDPNIGSCTAQNEAGVLELTSPDIVLPSSTNFARATFEHWVASEPGFDGGNLSISVNGGAWQLLPPSEYSFNNYNALLFPAANSTNPLAGQPSWTGTNAGSVNDGSWGRTHVNLGNFAKAGDTIRLRWSFGTDGCAGRTGWFVDNVNVFSCAPKIPALSVPDVQVSEGNAGEKQMAFTVLLSAPTIKAVSVRYELVDGTAQHGNDYDRISGTVVIPASTATQLVGGVQIFVTIKGDIVPEGNETFTLRLSNPVNATIGDSEATATIVDDDNTPPGSQQ